MVADDVLQGFKTRLAEAFDDAQVASGRARLTAVAKRYDVSRESARKWLKGEGLPDTKRLVEIADDLNRHVQYLLDGQGPKYLRVPENSESYVLQNLGTVQLNQIAVRGDVRAGFGHFYAEGEPGYGDWYVHMVAHDERAFALRVRGGSMGERIRDGDAIVIEPSAPPIVGEDVLIETFDGQLIVKTLVWRRNGELAVDAIDTGRRWVFREDELAHIYAVTAVLPASRIKHR